MPLQKLATSAEYNYGEIDKFSGETLESRVKIYSYKDFYMPIIHLCRRIMDVAKA